MNIQTPLLDELRECSDEIASHPPGCPCFVHSPAPSAPTTQEEQADV